MFKVQQDITQQLEQRYNQLEQKHNEQHALMIKVLHKKNKMNKNLILWFLFFSYQHI
jgi:hypothetical protein